MGASRPGCPGRLTRSITSPKRIIAAFAPKSAISAVTSRMPVSIAIRTIINEALTEYSHQRAGFRSSARLRSYQRWSRGAAISPWSIAARKRNAATAAPNGRS